MKSPATNPVVYLVLFVVPVLPTATTAQTPRKTARTFLKKHCISCHNKRTAEGDHNFKTLKFPFRTEQQLITADAIIDAVTLREMPPEDADQPTDDERVQLVEALRATINEARDKLDATGGRTVLRRLSNREYENTLAALFNRRVDTLGLTADFPKDATSRHMDNIGETLVTSGFLLDQYFQAANRLVEMRLNKPAIEPGTWHFTDNFKQYEELNGPHRSAFKFEYLCLYEQPNTDTRQGGYGHIEDFLEGVPVSGLYDIEVHAQAMHRDTHYDPKIFRIDFSEPFQLAVVPGDASKGHIHYPQSIEPILGTAIVPDDEPEWIKFRVWLEAGQTPRFIFPNGPYESRASVIEVNKRYKDEFEGKGYKKGVSRTHILLHGALPHIKIGEIKIHGPLEEPNGGNEEVAAFGPNGFQPNKALEQLYAFAYRAYRRPLTESDKTRIADLYEKRLSENATKRQAALDTIKLILCSPSFLYFAEIAGPVPTGRANDEERNAGSAPADQSTKPAGGNRPYTPAPREPTVLAAGNGNPTRKRWILNPYDLATRLSYALWAAPPDTELLAVAESGTITTTDEIKRQIERLLADERSNEFINGFLDAWLNLRDIGNQPPSRPANRDYYAENLPASMKQEARLFFRHLLDTNGPVTDLLDVDYTFVDKKLAKLYDLPEQKTLRLADGFQRVELRGTKQRGGVLGMAGVLTVSANGVDTSPVTRGVWVSENILGVTPPPPPDEVPEIESDTKGAKTIREKLAKHSADQTCNVCHRKIDPLGFALETFDPIGRWRTNYPQHKGKTLPIDPTGEFTTGETYEDFQTFKQVLKKTREEQFTRNLIEQLLTWTTGRHMTRADQFEIDDMLNRVQSNNAGLGTLLTVALTSDIARSP